MNIIKRNLASVLVSMVASIVSAQTVSFSLEPARLTAEETKAIEYVINSSDHKSLHLSPEEVKLFLQLLHNGNKTVAFGIAENGHFGMCYGTNVEAYIIRERGNGFAILYEIEDEDGDRARSASAKVSIKPPHAVLSASEIKLLKERLATALFVSEVDSIAYQSLLKNNKGTFGLGFADDDELGAMKVPSGSYTEAYIIRSEDGVALYYEIFNGDTDELLGSRQTAPISLK